MSFLSKGIPMTYIGHRVLEHVIPEKNSPLGLKEIAWEYGSGSRGEEPNGITEAEVRAM